MELRRTCIECGRRRSDAALLSADRGRQRSSHNRARRREVVAHVGAARSGVAPVDGLDEELGERLGTGGGVLRRGHRHDRRLLVLAGCSDRCGARRRAPWAVPADRRTRWWSGRISASWAGSNSGRRWCAARSSSVAAHPRRTRCRPHTGRPEMPQLPHSPARGHLARPVRVDLGESARLWTTGRDGYGLGQSPSEEARHADLGHPAAQGGQPGLDHRSGRDRSRTARAAGRTPHRRAHRRRGRR